MICFAESRLCRGAVCIIKVCIKHIQRFILSGGAVDKLLKHWECGRERDLVEITSNGQERAGLLCL